jgi:hypothetical protein
VRTWSISRGSTQIAGRSGRIFVRSWNPARAPRIRVSTPSMMSSNGVNSLSSASPPVRARARFSRFPTNRFRRSVSSSMVWSSSCRWPSSCSLQLSIRLVTPALIDASGVRRSWVTEENRAARIWLISASVRASRAAVSSRDRSTATPIWAATAPSNRWSGSSSAEPAVGTIEMVPNVLSPATTGMSTAGSSEGLRPSAVTGSSRSSAMTHRDRENRSTATRANSWRTLSSDLPDSSAAVNRFSSRLSCSRRSARARSARIRANRPPTMTATARKKNRAARSSIFPTDSVWRGGVKKKFSPRNDRMAAPNPLHRPPAAAAPTTVTM